jgi:hypothetical protein
MWNSEEAWLVYPYTQGPSDLQGKFIHPHAGTLGMAFVDIFKNGRLRKNLKFPIEVANIE